MNTIILPVDSTLKQGIDPIFDIISPKIPVSVLGLVDEGKLPATKDCQISWS